MCVIFEREKFYDNIETDIYILLRQTQNLQHWDQNNLKAYKGTFEWIDKRLNHLISQIGVYRAESTGTKTSDITYEMLCIDHLLLTLKRINTCAYATNEKLIEAHKSE